MYEAITNKIKVVVEPIYLKNESNPDTNRYIWAYRMEIENLGETVVQLKDRFWKISDANGSVQEVEGPGVIGQQAYIKAGARFEYTSVCPLTTSSGCMSGHYSMIDEDGEEFDVEIPAFSLDLPDAKPVLN